MIQTIKKVKDMANISSGPGEWKAPDWFLRGVIAVLIVMALMSFGGALVKDHNQIWDDANSTSANTSDIKELKEKSKTWDQTQTDVAVIRTDVSNMKDQNKEILRLLREKDSRRHE